MIRVRDLVAPIGLPKFSAQRVVNVEIDDYILQAVNDLLKRGSIATVNQ